MKFLLLRDISLLGWMKLWERPLRLQLEFFGRRQHSMQNDWRFYMAQKKKLSAVKHNSSKLQ